MRVAVLDMYDGLPNLGMNSIQEIISRYERFDVDVFDVRGQCEVPGLEYDIYIMSGGPGNPLEGDGVWDRAFFFLLNKLWKHNQQSVNKKYAFFICHSYQMVCHHLSLGAIVKRHRPSLGVMPVHLTEAGQNEAVFQGLDDPFFAADFRNWQVVRVDQDRFETLGCEILAMEKIRPHVPFERAVMAIRFSPEWIGVQFHPEADPEGMVYHFTKPEKKAEIIEKKGKEKYQKMVALAEDPDKLLVTYETVLPAFLEQCIEKIKSEPELNLVI